MKRWGETPVDALLPPETVLNQAEMAVIVCDRYSNLLYCNAFTEKLLGFGGSEYIGRSILSLGIAE
jgi:PAS domain-containing protein